MNQSQVILAAPPSLVVPAPSQFNTNKECNVKNKEARQHFPCKVYEMLEAAEDQNLKHIVSWNSDGTGFTVHNKDLFTKEIIPQYFNQTKYKSFQRQLSLYGFQRITNGENKGLRFHELLRRGNRDLCRSMKPIGYKPRCTESRQKIFSPPEVATTSTTAITLPPPLPTSSSSPTAKYPGTLGQTVPQPVVSERQQFPAVVSCSSLHSDEESQKEVLASLSEYRPVEFTSYGFPSGKPSPTEMAVFEGMTFYLMDSQNASSAEESSTVSPKPKDQIPTTTTLHPAVVDGQMKRAWEIGFAVAMTMNKPTSTIPPSTMEVACIDALDMHIMSA